MIMIMCYYVMVDTVASFLIKAEGDEQMKRRINDIHQLFETHVKWRSHTAATSGTAPAPATA